jgi:hypothetical protein
MRGADVGAKVRVEVAQKKMLGTEWNPFLPAQGREWWKKVEEAGIMENRLYNMLIMS